MVKRFKPSLEEQNNIIKLYTIDKLTSSEIGQIYKVSTDALIRFLRKNNIEIDRFRYKAIRASKYTFKLHGRVAQVRQREDKMRFRLSPKTKNTVSLFNRVP